MGCLLLLAAPHSGTAQITQVPSKNESDEQYLEKAAQIFQRPLTFYGKVLDNNNDPVAGAKVRYSFMDNPDPNGSGTKGEIESGQDGRFVIHGNGAGIYVEVSKNGYYAVPRNDEKLGSSGGFVNFDNIGNNDVPIPNKTNPAVFTLIKSNVSKTLNHNPQRSIAIPRDGTPVIIDLERGKVTDPKEGDLSIMAWTNNVNIKPNSGERYDWRCRITVLDGGIIERDSEWDFEAPLNGYITSDEFGYLKSEKEWRNDLTKKYYIKLSGEIYGYIIISMIAHGDHFIVVESYINPTPNDRNI